MISAIAQGTLQDDPQQRTSSKGTTFTTAKLRCPVGGTETIWIDVTVFSESLAAKLAALRAGAQVAVGGALEQYRWTSKAGEERVGFRLVATELISTRDAKARRERPAGTGDDEPPREAPARAARRGQAPAESQRGSLAEMEDDIPF